MKSRIFAMDKNSEVYVIYRYRTCCKS